jgi:choline kinase
MKSVFLAAGEGTRLRPLTEHLPKCMLPYRKKPLLEYGLDSMRYAGIENIIIVRGYLPEKINFGGVTYIDNPRYAETNMVATLFCAVDEFDDDLLVSYADIIYTPEVVKELISSQGEIGVVIDRDWYRLWSLRMENPLADAETLKMDAGGNIIELGKKPRSYDEIEGQYIGLIKFSKSFLPTLVEFYGALNKDSHYDGKDFDNMFMTTFLQLLIDAGFTVKAVPIHGGWLEFDSLRDFEAYENEKIF